MHENAAHGVKSRTSIPVLTPTRFMEETNRLLRLPRVTEFSVVSCGTRMGPSAAAKRSRVGLKMPGKNSRLTHSAVRKKSIGCLRIGPILAGQWDRLPRLG